MSKPVVFLLVCLVASVSVVTSPASGREATPAASGQSDQGDNRQEAVYVRSTALFKCLVELPNGYDPESTYPLVVALHGYGSNADHFMLAGRLFREAEMIYAAPQAPYAALAGRVIGYSWNLRQTGDEVVTELSDELTERYLLEVVAALRTRYSVDDVYLLGFSQGGAFAYTVAIENPSVFSGLIVFGSRFERDWFEDETLAAARGLRVFIAHGRSDKAVAYERSTEARDVLEALGFDVTRYAFDGGHQVPVVAMREALRWIQGNDEAAAGR